MKCLRTFVIVIVVSFACKEGEEITPLDSEALFFAFKGGNFNFRSIDAIHDPDKSLIFFWDAYLKKGTTYNYSTQKVSSQRTFGINQDGYADLGYANVNGEPEIYIPDDTKVEILNMQDLETKFTINTGHQVGGVALCENIVSVGNCQYSMENYNRHTGSRVSTSQRGGSCERIISGVYKDTVTVIGFPSGFSGFTVEKLEKNGTFISGLTIGSSFLRRILIRSSESSGYFVTSDAGHVYSFDGKYVGNLPATSGTFKDFAFSTDGKIIYALYENGNIQKFFYPSLQQAGRTFFREDDLKNVPERIFADDQKLIRIYNIANSYSSTEIHLRIISLDKIGS